MMPATLRRPPGPAEVLDVLQIRQEPLRFLTRMLAEYGDFSSHQTSGERVYLIGRPELARQVLKMSSGNYVKSATPDDAMLRPLLGDGLLTADGETWTRQRRMSAPAFRRPEVERFDDVITEAAQAMLARWRPGDPVRLDHEFTALTLSVLVRTVLGIDIAGIGAGFGRAVDAVNAYIGRYVPGEDADSAEMTRRRQGYLSARTFLNTVVETILAAHRTAGAAGFAGSDLLSAILASGELISSTEVRDQVLTLIMAGHETTAKALTWTFYLLDQHRAELEVIHHEVDHALSGRTPTAADLPALPACRRAVAEAMRLYPPVWLISRRAVGEDQLGGYHVPAGTLIAISPYVLHRHPAYWDRPGEYVPERFILDPRPSHVYLPFGGGARVCIGQHLAMVEAVLVLATVAQRVRLELMDGFPVEPEALVTLRPKHGMMMIPRTRG